MKIWSRSKLKYAKVANPSGAVLVGSAAADGAYKCAACGADINVGNGWISHLYVSDKGEHDAEDAFLVCRGCMDKETAEERDLISKYGMFNLPSPIEE